MKDILKFRKEWRDAILQLPDRSMQFDALLSVLDYAFDGVQPTDTVVSAVTSLMRNQIDEDNAKTQRVRELRIEAGKKGGAPKGNKNASKTSKNKQNKQNQANVSFGCFAAENEASKQAKQANACFNETSFSEAVTDENTTTETSKQAKQANACLVELSENSHSIYNNINNNNLQNSKKEKNTKKESRQLSALEQQFEDFRKAYPGRKRGFDTEFEAFKRKHKNWTEIIPLLMPALQRLIAFTEASKAAGQWTASFANLSTWLYQSRWEEELPEVSKTDSKETQQTHEADYSITTF